jgi:hypothetical protein
MLLLLLLLSPEVACEATTTFTEGATLSPKKKRDKSRKDPKGEGEGETGGDLFDRTPCPDGRESDSSLVKGPGCKMGEPFSSKTNWPDSSRNGAGTAVPSGRVYDSGNEDFEEEQEEDEGLPAPASAAAASLGAYCNGTNSPRSSMPPTSGLIRRSSMIAL